MSFGSLGWRSGASSSSSGHSANPRLAGLSRPSGSSSNRLTLASSTPMSRSLTSLGGSLGGSAVDQYLSSAASSCHYGSTPSHRRSPHVRRSTGQPATSSAASRLRASSQTNLSSYSPQTFVAPSTQTRASRIASSRPTTHANNTSSAVSNASSTTSLNSGRHYDSDFDRGSSRASSIHSVDSVDNDSLLNKNSRGQYSNNSNSNNNNGNLETSYSNNSASKNSRSGSTTSLASDSDLRNAANSANSTTDSGEVDYKKLCKQLLRENEALRRRIRELEEAEKRREQEVSREKRALQRTISEQEEELKSLGDVKADNVRLKDENGALIRVISKLSK